MITAEVVRDEATVRAMIEELDLESIKVKLVDPDEGEGWSADQADEVEKWYKRLLFLVWKYPDEPVVPNRFIDEFWHQHLLDTLKYAEDCERVFGHFFHHFPYFGMRGEGDARDLQRAFEGTLSLFQREFGEMPTQGCQTCSSSWCGGTPGTSKGSLKLDTSTRPRLR